MKKLNFFNFPLGKKRGIVAVQFNWIFILIVGAIILSFFITIAQKQRSISEANIAQTIQTDLRAIFSGASVSTETASVIEIPSSEILFDCEGFKVGKQMPVKFPYAFSPSLIKSGRNTLSAWSYGWSVPYRVTNFLYITSPDIRYIIVDDDGDLAEKLDEILPPNYIEKGGKKRLLMNKEKVTDASSIINDGNNYKIKLIYVNALGISNLHSSFKDADISAINIMGDMNEGYIDFYEKTGPLILTKKPSSGYIGKASLLGAVFSDNKDSYECSMNRALDRLKTVSEIYEKRTNKLSEDLGGNSCSDLLDTAKDIISGIKTGAENSDYADIKTYSVSLEDQNNIIQENSCPAVY